VIRSATVALAIALAGCSAPVGPESVLVLHVANRTANAAVVQGADTTDGVTSFSRIVTSCGGEVTANPTHDGSTVGEYAVAILLDPSGALDGAIERANGNLAAVDTSTLTLTTYWSRSGLEVADLPQWITITPDGVTISGQGPTGGTVSPPCPSFGPMLEAGSG
jgi:hypothetical protein